MFRVGMKVVCVDVRPRVRRVPRELTKGRIYTVSGVHFYKDGEIGIDLFEVPSKEEPGFRASFSSTRFRPIVERKTDISIFREILRKATKQADTDIGASA